MPLTFRRLRRFVAPLILVTASCGGRRPPPAIPDATPPVRVAAPVAPAAPPAPAPVDLAGYRTAIDLLANRIQAVSHREGRLVIDAGSPDFLKYIDGDWKTSWYLNEKD